MATKNRIAYALPIIQIMQIPLAKLPIQICLRLVYGERMGIVCSAIGKRKRSQRRKADFVPERSKSVILGTAGRLNSLPGDWQAEAKPETRSRLCARAVKICDFGNRRTAE